jgi:hypothetical protein
MKNKVVSISEKLPQPVILSDGIYEGVWGGYKIIVPHNDRTFILETEVGVRGMGVKVVVEVKDGIATFQEISN